MPDPRLGRIYSPDHRDTDYLMERKLVEVAPVGQQLWPVPHLYDQGQTPHCVGHACSGAMTAILSKAYYGATVTFDADALYVWANAHDGNSTIHDGSTVRAGLQGLVTVGDQVIASTDVADDAVGTMDKVQNYLWANTAALDADIDRLITWILTISPVVIGIDWYKAMFTPDAITGFVDPIGGVAGGHAIMIRGVNALDPQNTYFVLRNSWGPWGVTVNPDWTVDTNTPGGDALLTKSALVMLLKSFGEAGAVIDSLTPVVPTPPPTPTPTPVPVPPTPPTPTPPAPTPPAPGSSLWTKVEAIFEKAEMDVKRLLGL